MKKVPGSKRKTRASRIAALLLCVVCLCGAVGMPTTAFAETEAPAAAAQADADISADTDINGETGVPAEEPAATPQPTEEPAATPQPTEEPAATAQPTEEPAATPQPPAMAPAPPKTVTVRFVLGAEAEAAGVAAPAPLALRAGQLLPELPNVLWEDENETQVKLLYGWYTDEALTAPADPAAPVLADTTLYARWITHDPNTACTDGCDDPNCLCFCHPRALAKDPREGDYEYFILVKKVFTGLPKELIPSEFKVHVRAEKDLAGTNEFIGGIDPARLEKVEEGWAYTWRVPVPADERYVITETGYEVVDYNCQPQESMTVQVDADQAEVTKIEDIPTCKESKVDIGQMAPGRDWLLAIATNGAGTIIVSTQDLSAQVLKAVEDLMLTTNIFGGNYTLPLIPKNISDGALYEIPNGDKTFSIQYVKGADGDYIAVTDQKNWSNAKLFDFSVEGANNPTATLENKYVKKVTDVTVTKQITGNMGDVGKRFKISVTFDREVGAAPNDEYTLSTDKKTATFTLGNGGSVTISRVPIGAVITGIAEANEGGSEMNDYTPYYYIVNSDGSKTPCELPLEVPPDGLSLVVENNKNVTIDTGVILDSAPYLIILAVAVAGVLIFVKKRRDRGDDD